MIKAWLNMWKNTFHYKGTTPRKEYWLALIGNVIAMYVGLIPYALIVKALFGADVQLYVVMGVYMIAFHLPVFSIYARRTKDAGWKVSTTVLLSIAAPVISALIAGICPTCDPDRPKNPHTAYLKVLAVGFGIYFYGGFIRLQFEEVAFLPIIGLLLLAGSLIVFVIKNPKAFLETLRNWND